MSTLSQIVSEARGEVLYVGSNMLNAERRYVLSWVGAGVEGPGGVWELTPAGGAHDMYRIRNSATNELLCACAPAEGGVASSLRRPCTEPMAEPARCLQTSGRPSWTWSAGWRSPGSAGGRWRARRPTGRSAQPRVSRPAATQSGTQGKASTSTPASRCWTGSAGTLSRETHSSTPQPHHTRADWRLCKVRGALTRESRVLTDGSAARSLVPTRCGESPGLPSLRIRGVLVVRDQTTR